MTYLGELPTVYAIDHADVVHVASDTYPDRARTLCSTAADYAELPRMAAFAVGLAAVGELRLRWQKCPACFGS